MAIFANQSFVSLKSAADKAVVVQIEMCCIFILGFSSLAKARPYWLQKTLQHKDSSQWLKLEYDIRCTWENTTLFLSMRLNVHACISFHYFSSTQACGGTAAALPGENPPTHTQKQAECVNSKQEGLCADRCTALSPKIYDPTWNVKKKTNWEFWERPRKTQRLKWTSTCEISFSLRCIQERQAHIRMSFSFFFLFSLASALSRHACVKNKKTTKHSPAASRNIRITPFRFPSSSFPWTPRCSLPRLSFKAAAKMALAVFVWCRCWCV